MPGQTCWTSLVSATDKGRLLPTLLVTPHSPNGSRSPVLVTNNWQAAWQVRTFNLWLLNWAHRVGNERRTVYYVGESSNLLRFLAVWSCWFSKEVSQPTFSRYVRQFFFVVLQSTTILGAVEKWGRDSSRDSQCECFPSALLEQQCGPFPRYRALIITSSVSHWEIISLKQRWISFLESNKWISYTSQKGWVY